MKIGRDEHTYWRLDKGAHNRKKLEFLTLGVGKLKKTANPGFMTEAG